MITAQSLADNNLAYREPALYDELLTDVTVTDEVLDVVDSAGATTGSVLDLGCGTGRVLTDLRTRRGWQTTGVDLQPELLAYARTRSRGLVLHSGDIRTVRLDATFDLLLCLGNTLSYLHSEPELTAAFTTMAAHCHPGTLLVIATLDQAGRDTHRAAHIQSDTLGEIHVDTATRQDSMTGILTMTRVWRFPSGRVETDHIARRVWPKSALVEQATVAGFRCFPALPSLTLSAVYNGEAIEHRD